MSDSMPGTPQQPPRMGKLFARMSFLPSLAINLVLDKVSTRTWYNAVDSTVILGALPFKNMTEELVKRQGVRAVVSMNEDYELRYLSNSPEEWRAAGVDFLQLSTTDMFEAPSQEKLSRGVQFILQHHRQLAGAPVTQDIPLDSEFGRVYVHCKAGRTRSACLVACYLMHAYGMGPSEAVQKITAARPHIWLGTQQHRAIQIYFDSLASSRGAS